MDTSDHTTISLKRCNKCGDTKSPSEFRYTPQSRYKDKLHSWCKSCERSERKQRYSKNKSIVLAKSKEYRAANPEREKEWSRNWLQRNLDKHRTKQHNYRSRQRSLPSTFTNADWVVALNYFNGGCAYCGNPPSFFDQTSVLHQEHHIPVNSGGAYTPDNIIPACQSCNLSKNDKDATDWCVAKFGKRKAQRILNRIKEYLATHKGES
jgi:5-methylcytosine-specific restriction endonuclease McrA